MTYNYRLYNYRSFIKILEQNNVVEKQLIRTKLLLIRILELNSRTILQTII